MRYSDYLKFLKDPSDNIMYSAHCYFDEDRSGRYAKSYESSGANPMTGVERIKPFIDWCNANNKKAFVGEFGIPKTDDRWF
ncbi:cellulase family glycosylhydrolase, partial [Acinetobacter baumannii]